MDLAKFGSREWPLRASSLPLLIRCPHRHILIALEQMENSSSKAADTGSAVHAAIHTWNMTGDVKQALESMRMRHAEFPEADLDDAALSVKPYCADPRNAPKEILQSEVQVELEIPIPDGLPVYIMGRVDQVRSTGIWDIKNSARQGFELTHDYAYQLAAYARALGVPVGGIILPTGYRKRGAILPSPSGVFWPTLWEEKHLDILLTEVVKTVIMVRRGEIPIRPGPHCSYCPAGSFLNCVAGVSKNG